MSLLLALVGLFVLFIVFMIGSAVVMALCGVKP